MRFNPVLLEAEAEALNQLPIPAEAFGLIAFLILVTSLLVTLAIGKGRPHS